MSNNQTVDEILKSIKVGERVVGLNQNGGENWEDVNAKQIIEEIEAYDPTRVYENNKCLVSYKGELFSNLEKVEIGQPPEGWNLVRLWRKLHITHSLEDTLEKFGSELKGFCETISSARKGLGNNPNTLFTLEDTLEKLRSELQGLCETISSAREGLGNNPNALFKNREDRELTVATKAPAPNKV